MKYFSKKINKKILSIDNLLIKLKSLRKKQKMLDDSIQNLNIDGSQIPYSISTKGFWILSFKFDFCFIV